MDEQRAFDLSILKKMTGNDYKALRHLSKLFIDTTRESIKDIKTYLDSDELDLIQKSLHRLKPNIEMFGMISIHKRIIIFEGESQLTDDFKLNLTKLLIEIEAALHSLEGAMK